MGVVEKEDALVLWFEEIDNDDVNLVGGKNASLGEMYRDLTKQGIQVCCTRTMWALLTSSRYLMDLQLQQRRTTISWMRLEYVMISKNALVNCTEVLRFTYAVQLIECCRLSRFEESWQEGQRDYFRCRIP